MTAQPIDTVGDYCFTAADVAKRLGYESTKTVTRRAAKLRLGIQLGGRAGNRYSERDVQALIESLKPAAPVQRRRRRRT